MFKTLVRSVLASLLIFSTPIARAELSEIKIAGGLGIGFLPMYVMQD